MEKITVILKPNKENIERTAKALKLGAIIINPTESSYGIGCDFTNKEAIKTIIKIKKRKQGKHLISLVSNLKMAKKYGKIDDIAERLIKRFMPGPLTLSVPGKGKLKEFNFRITENRVTKRLINKFGKPLISTSANISGKKAIYCSEDLKQFFGKIDVILDSGDLPKRSFSTIVSIRDNKVKILREGAIPKEKIKEFLKVKL